MSRLMRLFTVLLAALPLLLAAVPARAQDRPLIMPVGVEPGANTWLMGQAYGNTPGAYNFGDAWYRAGQGLHFGIDLSMPCGTPLVAVADGVVAFVDDMGFGSGPHNLILRHDALGFTSLYGHLLARPTVSPGQAVRQGDPVGLSGDPDVTCFSRPHLHYELRSLDYQTTFNPIAYIQADWHTLALTGGYSNTLFQGDMDNARRWMSLEDQPDVRFWGQRLNAYNAVYPPGNGQNAPANAIPDRQLPALDINANWTLNTIGSGRCCWQNFWHPTDAATLLSIDGGAAVRAGLYRWDLATPALTEQVGTTPPPHRSPAWTLDIRMDGAQAVLFNPATASERRINTNGAMPSLDPTDSGALWVLTRPTVPGEQRAPASVWVQWGDQPAREMFAAPGANARWLNSTYILLSVPGDQRTTALSLLDAITGEVHPLGTWSWLRNATAGPGGAWIVFTLTNQSDPEQSGVYAMRAEPSAQAVKLPFFGGWRWRDRDELYVIPLDFVQPTHTLWHYDLESGAFSRLNAPTFTVMNGDWNVSADGRRISLRERSTVELSLLSME